MKELIRWIREKPELAGLSDEIVTEAILKTTNKKTIEELEKKPINELRRNGPATKTIKQARAFLRTIYGVFWQTTKKRETLLASLAQDPTIESHEAILNMHPSTRERLPHYEEIYSKIWNITGEPNTILDLAAGLNPLSYPLLGCKPRYIANEIAQSDVEFIEEYFKIMKINGKALQFDLITQTEKLLKLNADVCLVLKTLDGLEVRERHCSKRILESIPAKWIVCSFPTTSLGGSKTISIARRNWLDHLAQDKEWKVQKFSVPGESFVILQKS